VNSDGWRPLRRRPDHRGAEAFVVTPFVRLARVHSLNAASDAAVAVALAGSIFFSISPDESRARVALYLLLTMAPFAVVTPLLGPAIDRFRGGRRMMILVTLVGRVILGFFLIQYIESLLLFPLAFSFLVLQKGYAVAKSAVVPRLVQSEENLVDANSRLALISALSSMSGAALAGFGAVIIGPPAAAGIGMVGFVVATILALQMTPVVVAPDPPEDLEKAELRDAPILLAGSATAVLRAIVGFVTFLLAFEFRGGEDGLDVGLEGAAVGGATATARGVDITGDPAAPFWHFGVVLLAAGVGALVGARLAPALRQRLIEERMLQGILVGLIACALFAGLSDDLFGAVILSGAVAVGAGAGKLAFDALVQRDAPDANHGRSFARFEARFQIAWVVGAFVPAVIRIPFALGAAIVAAAAGAALISYVIGQPLGSLAARVAAMVRPDTGPPAPVVTTATDDPTLDLDPDADPSAYELSDDDLRPSQPQPPAGTEAWADPEAWTDDDPAEPDGTPWISSVEGVEIHPSATPPELEIGSEDD
jgi:hypothetical protein